MVATDVIRQIESLPPPEQAKIFDWLHGRDMVESPEMLAALDAAAESAEKRGVTPVSEVRKLLPQWTSKSA
jgi:hypothetical protein